MREAGLARAQEEEVLARLLRSEEELIISRLRDSVTMLGLVAPLLLVGVDAFTRDDLLTLTVLTLGAQLLRPGLVLEETACSGLLHCFEALHVEPSLLRDLADHTVRRSERSGEWLVVDFEYTKFLASVDKQRQAEPLQGIVRQKTVLRMDLPRLEAALQSLAVLLSGDEARDAFFRSLLELGNACTINSFQQPLEKAFIDSLHREASAEELGDLKLRQQKLLSQLQRRQEQADAAASTTNFAAFERTLADVFKRLLFERLRLLCAYRLLLASVSAYNALGDAVRLAALLVGSGFVLENVQLYRLLCLHRLLDSLGFGLGPLRRVLELLAPSSGRRPDLLLSTFASEEVRPAEKLFFQVKAQLSPLAQGGDTARLLTLLGAKEKLTAQAKALAEGAARFARHFPAATGAEAGGDEACQGGEAAALETFAGDLRAEMGLRHRDEEERQALVRAICAVNGFFEPQALR